MAKEFEDVLEKLGSYGRYQKKLVWLFLAPLSFYLGIATNAVVFQTTLPRKFWCNVEGRQLTNYTEAQWKNVTIPRDENGAFEKCSQYEVSYEEGSIFINTSSTEDCQSGWSHDRSVYQETVGTQHDWLCDKELYSAHLLSVTTAGNSVGTLLFPLLADKYTGRRLMFYISLVIHTVFSTLFMLVPNHASMMAARFLAGMSFETDYQMPYLIILELTSADKRALVCTIAVIAWTIGLCVTALLAWVLPHWWYLNMIISFPAVLFFAGWRFLPESPRWLLSKGKQAKCTDILMDVVKANGKGNIVSRKEVEKDVQSLCTHEELTLKELWHYKTVIFRIILLLFMFGCSFFSYICLIININILPDQPFLGSLILNFIQLPSNVLSLYCVNYLGRKFSNIFSCVVLIVTSYIATFFLDESASVYLLIVVSFAKVFGSMSLHVVYVMGTELIPTPIRSTGLGAAVVAGYIATTFSPYVVTPGINPAIQYWAMIGSCVVVIVLTIPLPETVGLPLPQTFHEGDVFGKHRPLFKWINYWNMKRYDLVSKEDRRQTEELSAVD